METQQLPKVSSRMKTNMRRWIAALRSGKYNQTQQRLQDNEGYCCLGVACDLFIPKSELKVMHHSKILLGASPSTQPNAPQWLKSINSDFRRRMGYSLMRANDKGIQAEGVPALTFEEIADLLQLVYLEEADTSVTE